METSGFPPLDSYSTAVVLLPPAHVQHSINLLRSGNDKVRDNFILSVHALNRHRFQSFPRWTSHLTMLYPFVHPSALSDATSRLRSALDVASHDPFTLELDHVAKFINKSYNTVFLAPSPSSTAKVQNVFTTLSSVSGYKGRPLSPHMTLGQAQSETELSLLQQKGALVLRNHDLSWDAGSVVILCKDETDGGKMKIARELFLRVQSGSDPPGVIAPERPLTFTCVDGNWASAAIPGPLSVLDGKLRLTSMNILNDDAYPLQQRFSLLKRDILSRVSDVLCFQEVSEIFLPTLLSDPEVRSRYAYSTCGPSSVLPNSNNIIVLSSLPFVWQPIVLSDNKHKPASLLTFAFPRPLILAVVHFTAGHTPPLASKREAEAAALLTHLRTQHAGAEFIIVGDSNFDADAPTSWVPEMDDVWTLGSLNQPGETYDPGRNALATETVREVKTAFRYDRIYAQKCGSVQVERAEVVKENAGEQPASDHWAIHAELDIGGLLAATSRSTSVTTLSEGHITDNAGGSLSNADAALDAWVRANGGYPSEELEAARNRAISLIRQVLGGVSSTELNASPPASPLPPGVKVILEPVGSRMLGVDTAASDLDMLAVSNLGQITFFDLMRARIRSWTRACQVARVPCTFVLRRFVRDAAVPMLRLQVHGVEVDLQYAPAAKVAERWAEVSTLPSEDPLFSLPASTLRVLNAYRDNRRLLALLPGGRLPSFRLALRAIKLFVAARGLSGAKLGFLGGVHLTLLLARLALSSTPDGPSTASGMLAAFLSRYARFPYADEIVSVEGAAAGSTYRRTPREALAILSVERPLINVAAGATAPNVATIRDELVRADALMNQSNESWATICGTPDRSARAFLSKYPAYVKVDLSFWGMDAMRMRALLGYVESRLVKVRLSLSLFTFDVY